MMKPHKRKLGYWEELCQTGNDHYHGNGVIAAVAKFSYPTLSLKRFEEAVRLLQAQQPLLRAHVKKSTLNSHFIIDDSENAYLPFQVLVRDSDSMWESLIELELNRPPRNQDYQWRLILLHCESDIQHELILISGHNIGDGISIAYFFDSLFRIYEDLQTKNSFPIYPPVEKLLRHMDNKKTQPPEDFIMTPIPYENTTPLGGRVTKNIYHSFSSEHTKSLLDHCKYKDFSVNAFINAVTLVSLAKILKKELSSTLHTPVNLRKWCQPEIPNDFLVATFRW